ncbi:myb-binding protein 1A-like protein [Argiope bruennichi]|uniref:myb-binding protein 1A-like protein n=1 Tax=Argiope bruennichi TaxID=94029 RepID=UPI0024945DBF|nr:myb-binding protein 1A-like protein [Argiope bruennichi]
MQLPVPDGLEKAPKNIDKNIFDLLWKLTDNKTKSRIEACSDILSILRRKQDEAENSREPTKDLQYCLERLVRGLASSRDSARLGFSLLLTEILKHMDVEIEDILELVKQHLSVSSALERKDAVFGQLFACVSIVRSGKLAHHSHLSFVVTMLNDLWHGRSYILKACYEILAELFSQLSEEIFVNNVWPHLKEKLSFGWEKCSADLIWPLFLSIRMFPSAVTPKFLKKKWGAEDILSSENYDHIKKILRQTTSCLPILHPLCCEMLHLCRLRSDGKELWRTLIDDNLFELDQTEKAFVGFEMAKKALQEIHKKKVIKYMLSPKFCMLFTKSFLNTKHPMNPAATSLAAFLSSFVKESFENHDVQFIILKIFLNSSAQLDQILKRKEVTSIIQHLSPVAIRAYFELLKSIAIGRTESDEADRGRNHRRFQAVLQIGNLVSHDAIVPDIEWRLHVVKFLLIHAFFKLETPNEGILHCDEANCMLDIDEKLRETFRNSFFKALNSLYHRTEQHLNSIRPFLSHLLCLTQYAEELMAASDFTTPCFDLDKVREPWAQMEVIVHKLSKQSNRDGLVNETYIFQTLFLELAFHSLQDPEFVSGIFEELHICCEKALDDRKLCKPAIRNEPFWVSVVVDILLSLLSRNSQPLRYVVNMVFPLLCPFITKESLQLILDVINPAQADEPVMVNEEVESDVSFESGSSSEDESDAEQNTDGQMYEKFRTEVKEALGPAAEESDSESVVFSDTEMFKLDEALGKAFKKRIQGSQAQKKEEEKALLDFRVRCLDLLTIYFKETKPLTMEWVLLCIGPILSAYEDGHKGKHHAHLLHKAVSTLQTLEKVKKFSNLECVKESQLKEQLEILVAKCQKETNLTVAQKLYSLCVYIVMCFRKLSEQNPEKKSKKTPAYLKIYLSELETFAKGNKTNVFPQFFVSFMEAYPDLAYVFIGPLKEYAFSTDIRIYRRTQCLGLLLEAIKYTKGQDSVTAEQWLEIESSIIPSAIEILKSTLNGPEFKPVFVNELLNVVYSLRCILKEKTDQSLLEKTDILPFLMEMDNQKVKKLTSKGKSVRRKIILALGGKIPSNKKSKPNTVSLDTETTKRLEAAELNGMESDPEQTEDLNSSEQNGELNNSNQNDSLNSSKRKLKSKKDKKKKKQKMDNSSENVIEIDASE